MARVALQRAALDLHSKDVTMPKAVRPQHIWDAFMHCETNVLHIAVWLECDCTVHRLYTDAMAAPMRSQ